jgi:succinoglycan biosynthesis protein ExoM
MAKIENYLNSNKIMETASNHISICICTYKRPELLLKLLKSLQNQITENLFTYSAIVVDNDSNQSAEDTVAACKKTLSVHIDYFCEPEQNIALARNKAVKNANGNLVAFIDDDEFPENQWLLNMFKAINNYQSDGILGPVLPHFEEKPPLWVLSGHFFERPTHRSGYVLEWQNTRTGNALLRKSIFNTSQKLFDPLFGSGGEDRDFFKRMIDEGYVFMWCNEAPVFETVPPSRWTRSVLLKRALLRGKMALNSAKSKHMSVLYSGAAIVIYLCCLPFFFISGQHIFMKYLIKTCDHLGKLFAFLGINLVKEKYVSG